VFHHPHHKPQQATTTRNKPARVQLATKDPAAARDFYSKLFGWDIEVNPDPQYGGYGRAKHEGKDVAGIGGSMSPDAPSAWSVYIGTDDIEGLSKRVIDAGGKVVAPAFDIGDQGKMAVYQDPAGAFISAWQAERMGGFETQGRNAFGWAEVNARGVERVLPFYEQVFGWTLKPSGSPDQPYTEFQVGGESIGGAAEMNPMVPPQVPSYWLAYFTVDDVDALHRKAIELGATEQLAPLDFPGGRMSIVSDPQGASFGLLSLAPS
jgi:predicted enzyme related to lactoylglutathione lyase